MVTSSSLSSLTGLAGLAPRTDALRPALDNGDTARLFGYTGMGWLTYQALLNRDLPLIQDTVFVIAGVVMLTNLAVDLLYVVIDPRIRLG